MKFRSHHPSRRCTTKAKGALDSRGVGREKSERQQKVLGLKEVIRLQFHLVIGSKLCRRYKFKGKSSDCDVVSCSNATETKN